MVFIKKGKSLKEAFPAVENRIANREKVYGRHILGIPELTNMDEILAAQKRAHEKWEAIEKYGAEHDPIAEVYAHNALKLVDEAAKNHQKECPAALFE